MPSLLEQVAVAARETLDRSLTRLGLHAHDVAGCALLTDREVGVFHLAILTTSELAQSTVPNIQFRPTEWQQCDDDRFEEIRRALHTDAWNVPRTTSEHGRRRERVFGELVDALASVRGSVGLRSSAFVVVCSAEDDLVLTKVEDANLDRLNPDPELLERARRWNAPSSARNARAHRYGAQYFVPSNGRVRTGPAFDLDPVRSVPLGDPDALAALVWQSIEAPITVVEKADWSAVPAVVAATGATNWRGFAREAVSWSIVVCSAGARLWRTPLALGKNDAGGRAELLRQEDLWTQAVCRSFAADIVASERVVPARRSAARRPRGSKRC